MTFSAVLLAGGESRRMGRDKATIEFHGQPLWQRPLQILRELNPAVVFVSARTKRSWLPAGTEFLPDDPPSRGPLSGLAITLTRMQTTHLIALAVDMPFMNAAELGVLCLLAEPGRGVVPVIDERAEPLAAVYPCEIALEFSMALAGNDFSLQPLVEKLIGAGGLIPLAIPESKRHLYRSLNTPEDLQGGAVCEPPT